VEYVQSAEMIANSFIKVLPGNKWAGFLHQVGLVDISHHEVTNEARLEEIQDQLEDLALA
jgi:hypothetical protein